MKITVNGKKYIFDKKLTILTLLKELNLDNKPIVVEYNRDIIIKENYPSINLSDGDNLELITFVGGG